jgi:adenylate kinase family enzyme
MGVRNYLIDGGSGTGKTAVCDALRRRGYHAVHGDRELRDDRGTAREAGDRAVDPHLPPVWDLAKVEALLADRGEAVTFFCGGCRNSSEFIDRLDGVFVLEVDDLETVMRRIDARVAADPSDWGGRQEERETIMRLHRTKEGIAPGSAIDASGPLEHVVDEILRRVHAPAA